MFPDKPKARAFFVRLSVLEKKVPGDMIVHWAHWQLYQINDDLRFGTHYRLADLGTPCKSNLHKVLKGLLHDWDWKKEGDIQVTEEQAKYLKIMMENQKDYKYWKQALDILKTKGKEEGWKWIVENTPLLKLRNELKVNTDE